MTPSEANFGRDRAFTLVELLVVVGILVVLAAMLTAGAGKMMQKANLSKCVSNLRQIGVGFGLYLGDHNMSFPPTSSENQVLVGGAKGTYPGYDSNPAIRPLNAYVDDNYKIFKCPADVGYRNNPNREAMQPVFKGESYFSVIGSSYRYNARSAKDVGRGSLTRTKGTSMANTVMYKMSDIKNPSHLIVMGDSDVFALAPTTGVPWYTHWHGVKKRKGEADRPIANALFADWHVETIVVTDEPSPVNFGDNYHFDVNNTP